MSGDRFDVTKVTRVTGVVTWKSQEHSMLLHLRQFADRGRAGLGTIVPKAALPRLGCAVPNSVAIIALNWLTVSLFRPEARNISAVKLTGAVPGAEMTRLSMSAAGLFR